jgi:proline iminopeptidase
MNSIVVIHPQVAAVAEKSHALIRDVMYLDVGDGHTLFYEVHGSRDPKAPVAIVLHGGPGGGSQRGQLRAFNLKRWRVVLFDQRGCGASTPLYSLHKNTTWDLVGDIEKIRKVLGLDRWTVFGGSWGSTLALAYASKHLDHVDALVLRGIYLGEQSENDWLYREGGASRLYPEGWASFSALVPNKSAKKNLIGTYRRLLRNKKTRRRAAAAWWGWEGSLSFLKPRPDKTKAREVESLAILENHYFHHNCWLRPGQLLAAAAKIPRSVPVHIIQGRYDLVCPAVSAYRLSKAIRHSHLTMTMAGHAGSEPATAAALRRATDALLSGS